MSSHPQEASDNYKGVWNGRIGFGETPALLIVGFVQGYINSKYGDVVSQREVLDYLQDH